jgi:ribulose-phosphate 3-epimerase
MMPVEILPSVLAADFARLGDQIGAVVRAGASRLHLDVMDGHFVPNLSMGPPVVESVRRYVREELQSNAILDVHLMIEEPDRYVGAFARAGADQISVHQEACVHLDRTLQLIRSQGVKAGVVLNPATPVATLTEVLDLADFVLLMSVNPGFGGQKFIPSVLRKARELARMRSERGLGLALEMDGGIGLDNAAEIAAAGVDWLVAGSSVFHTVNPGHAFQELTRAARSAASVTV